MKTLIYGWASYKIPDKTGVDPNNVDRQTLYAISLRQLLKSAPQSADIVIADNTVSTTTELQPALKKELENPQKLASTQQASGVSIPGASEAKVNSRPQSQAGLLSGHIEVLRIMEMNSK